MLCVGLSGSGLRFKISGVFRVKDLGFRVQDLGFIGLRV